MAIMARTVSASTVFVGLSSVNPEHTCLIITSGSGGTLYILTTKQQYDELIQARDLLEALKRLIPFDPRPFTKDK